MGVTMVQSIEKLNGKRQFLAEKLPLKIPFSISITTANVCNLKCEFCAISEKDRKRNKSFLDYETFKLAMDSLISCKWHLKQIVLVGLGEPLLNKNIVDFVSYIKKNNIADKVHIVTNGVLLTHEMTDKLLNAGLDVLRVSVNGISAIDYEKYTGVKINFEQLLDNLEYFHKQSLKMSDVKSYVKIMDYQIETDEKKRLFKELFESRCDVINIEYLTEMSTTMDYSDKHLNKSKGLKGFNTVRTDVCPLPFYHIYLNAEGTISACCVAGPWYTPPALQMGDLHTQSIDEIWNGKNFYDFFCRMLEGGKNNAHEICKKCKAMSSYIYPEDVIDSDKERILNELKENHSMEK